MPTPATPLPDTAAALVARIRTEFIRPLKVQQGGWLPQDALLPGAIVLTEVPAPGESNRRIDALAIGLTRARAGIDGFEVKVSRSDWLHELHQPGKADAWYPHTHRWWIVAPSTTIVNPEELPDGWGLMVPNPRSNLRLKVVVKAATREPIIDWPVLWEIVKKVDRGRADEVKAAAAAVRAQMQEEAKQQNLRAAELTPAADDYDARIATTLTALTGLTPAHLASTLTHLEPWGGEALRAIFAVTESELLSQRSTWLIEQAKRRATAHQETAEALLHVAGVLSRGPSSTSVETTS